MHTSTPLGSAIFSGRPDRFVLVIDDHEPSLSRLQQVIELAGFACVAKLSSVEAIAYCERRRPSLVVTDLAMPVMDGRAVGLSLKARFPSMPLLLLTGEDLGATELHELEATFETVLAKPLQVEPFLHLLKDLLPPRSALA